MHLEDKSIELEKPEVESIDVELNRIESVSGACRLSFVIRNRMRSELSSLQWDLVFFNTDGLIASRMAAEAAPLPIGKTSVKYYDVPEQDCDDLARVLLNSVILCEGGSADLAPMECLRRTSVSSRTRVEFLK